MLRPQPAAYPASRVALWPLSYRRMERRAGFEPATSRLSVEVTAIFTTDRDGVGGERSMLLLPLRAIRLSARRSRTCSALSRLYHEVTDIFTTARPMLSHQPLKDTLGNGRYRRSVTTTQMPSLRMDPAPGRVQTFSEAASRCVCQRREAYPLCRVEKYPTSSPPASVEPRSSRQTNFYCGAVDAPHIANPLGSLCHRCPAHRLVPSGRPRALGHAPLQREPRDPGLPFRPMPGCSNGPHGGQQKTLRSGRLGRVREKRTVDLAVRQDRSHEPGMRYRLAVGHSTVAQIFRSCAALLGSCCLSRTEVFVRARDIRPQLADVKRCACEDCKTLTTRYGRTTCQTISALTDFASAGSQPGSTIMANTASIIRRASRVCSRCRMRAR